MGIGNKESDLPGYDAFTSVEFSRREELNDQVSESKYIP